MAESVAALLALALSVVLLSRQADGRRLLRRIVSSARAAARAAGRALASFRCPDAVGSVDARPLQGLAANDAYGLRSSWDQYLDQKNDHAA